MHLRAWRTCQAAVLRSAFSRAKCAAGKSLALPWQKTRSQPVWSCKFLWPSCWVRKWTASGHLQEPISRSEFSVLEKFYEKSMSASPNNHSSYVQWSRVQFVRKLFGQCQKSRFFCNCDCVVVPCLLSLPCAKALQCIGMQHSNPKNTVEEEVATVASHDSKARRIFC